MGVFSYGLFHANKQSEKDRSRLHSKKKTRKIFREKITAEQEVREAKYQKKVQSR